MNEKYSVSVIVPVYNAEKYLKKCIDSILNQTLKNIEIILINDGSTDNSAEILDKYANEYDNIRVINQKNSGLAVARNVGLENASGEYIGFVDSDDYISIDMYKCLYEVAAIDSIDIVTCGVNIVSGNKITATKLEVPTNKILYKSEIENLIHTAHRDRILWFACKSIFKLEMLKKNNIVFYDVIGEDSPFNLECLLCSNKIFYIDQPYYYYVQTLNSITRLKYKENLLKRLEDLYYIKNEVYYKYNINFCYQDLNRYNMEHTIPMLISNELNHKIDYIEKIKVYKQIRNSEMIKEAYKNCSVNLIKSKLKYMALLLKFRMYFILAIMTKV